MGSCTKGSCSCGVRLFVVTSVPDERSVDSVGCERLGLVQQLNSVRPQRGPDRRGSRSAAWSQWFWRHGPRYPTTEAIFSCGSKGSSGGGGGGGAMTGASIVEIWGGLIGVANRVF